MQTKVAIKRIAVSLDGLGPENDRRIRDAALNCGATWDFIAENAPDRAERIREADVLFGQVPAGVIESSKLRFVQLNSSAFDPYCTQSLLTRTEFTLANARGVTGRAVAEHALAMIFALARQLPFHERHRQTRTWQRASSYRLLRNSTITIIGTGAIGGELGRMCHALDARVLAVQRAVATPDFAVRTFPLTDFDDALRETEHLVICLPVIGLTKHLIGAKELALLPPGAYLYNLSRATLLDYDALQKSLEDGRLGGAGLDVFAEEPLSQSSPFWQMDNVIVSPHAGGRFSDEMTDLTDLFLANLDCYRLGLPMRNVVIGAQNGEATR